MRPFYLSLAAVLALSACADSTPSGTSGKEGASDVETVAAVVEEQVAEMGGDSADQAGADETSEIRSLEAHVHGAAKLALVLDGDRVTAELDTPLYNVLGFEAEPQSEAERLQVEAANLALSNPASLMVFSGQAGCVALPLAEPVSLFADMAGAKDMHDHETHDDHDHDDHAHSDEHDHEKEAQAHDHDEGHKHEEGHDHGHDDHAHEGHDHSDHDHAEHREARLTYTFACERPDALDSVTVTMFSAFPRLEALEVVYLGPNTQASFDLSPSNNRASLGS